MSITKDRFFKKCPYKKCGAISGFNLTKEVIEKDEEYFCQECRREIKLSKFQESDITFFVYQENRKRAKGGVMEGKELIEIETF